MKLTILGSGTCLPQVDRNASGYLLEYEDSLFLLDAGDGISRQIVKAGYDPLDIDFILLSHWHFDHFAGLLMLLQSYMVRRRTKPLTIFGPDGFAQVFSQLADLLADAGMATTAAWSDANYERTIQTIGPDPIKFGGLQISAYEMAHASHQAVGYRINSEEDKVFAYSGDTALCDNLIPLCQDADLAVVESSTAKDNPLPGHLTLSQALNIGDQAQVKHLVLTHFYPGWDCAAQLAKLPKPTSTRVSVASDLAQFDI